MRGSSVGFAWTPSDTFQSAEHEQVALFLGFSSLSSGMIGVVGPFVSCHPAG